MSEHTPSTDTSLDRLLAHERLSTGALASWMRACATHPWRVMIAWVGIIAGLILLVATVGGSLKDEFEIPGSDTQRATDLIEAEFAAEQGGVLNLVFAAPEGERLDTPERQGGDRSGDRRAEDAEFDGDRTGRATPAWRASEIPSARTPSPTTDGSPTRRRSSTGSSTRKTVSKSSPSRMPSARRSRPPAMTVEFNGDAEFPPIEQGTQELLGLLAALIVLLIVFRTLVATAIPLALAIVALMTAFLLLFILAGLTDINTITPLLVSMIGLGVGIDYSLFIVTRFRQFLHEGLSPRDAAAEAGASAGRATLFAGLTVAISVSGLAFFGLDFVTKLGIGSALGVLTTVLMANSLLIAVLARLGERRGIVRHIMFGILTLGLYWWYWAYKTHKTTKERTGQGLGGPLGLVLWILFYPINAFVIPAEIGRMYRQAGKETRLTGWTGLWLFPFGLLIVPAFVWWWKVQGAMNRFLEGDPDVAKPAPGSTA